ncbi:MAG: phospholipid carrier-dependent glycosyltransferase [Candidatus Omnitrophica bacterium]|nr:phospholipid carrier-dependent glycosyltransferase [Candidatus Omnitrophota bacterium]
MKDKSSELFFLTLAILTWALLFSYHLGFPASEYYDEVYFVPTAREYLSLNQTTTDTAHPPLGKLFLSLSLLTFGDTPWAWRIFSLFCGSLFLFVIYYLTKILTKNRWLASLVTFLMAVEGIHITQSRIAMLNAQMSLWMFLSLLVLLPYLQGETEKRLRSFFFSGIFLGLTISIRWVGAGIIGIIGPLLLIKFLRDKDKLGFLRDFFMAYILITTLIYIASHSIIPLGQGYKWSNIFTYQAHMARYHATLQEGHTYGSEWWGWPLLVRPIWYFFERKGTIVNGILCIGNPAIYWMIPVAMFYVLGMWLKERKFLYGFVIFGFLSQWLPWALIGRVKFFHYFYAAVPFALLGIALLIREIWRYGTLGKWLVCFYILLVFIMFIYWFPLWTGYPISDPSFQSHLWFKKAWI